MRFDLDDLPSEPALLQHLIRDMAAAVEHRDGEIERLKSIIKTLQRAQFGRRSERLDPDQLALALEEIDSDLAREEEKRPHGEKQASERPPRRKPLPDHLSREEVRLDIESTICSCCGGALHVIGESVSEMLDWVPAELRVIRTTRPKYACRTCETVAQAPAQNGRSPAAWRRLRCLPRCWSANIAITRRCIGSRRSSPAMGSIFRVRRSPDGSAAPAGGSRRCTNALQETCLLRITVRR